MADTDTNTVAAAGSASPVAQTPEPVAAQAAPAPVETPAEPVTEPKVEAKVETPERQLTLLEKFDAEQKDKPEAKAEPEAKPEAKADEKKDEKSEKPAEAAKPAENPEKKAEAEKRAEKPLDPVEYKYTLPETLKMDDTLKGEVHKALDQFRANPSEGVQGLIDLHNKQMTAFAEEMGRNQVKVWNDTRKGWQTEVLADSELGGAGHHTAMGAIARMRDLFVSEKDRPEFESFLQVTGAGDHPAFLRMLHRAARYFDEAPLPPPNPKPVPGNGQRAPSRLRDIYGNRAERG